MELLLKWNKTYNLTAITDLKEIQIKHFEDSLSPLPFLKSCERILDIGTGGGFPGIPLKIERPELEVILLDSQRKKISFCEEVIRQLGLKKISAHQGRAEDPKMIKTLGLFNAVICRATFSIHDFLTMAGPYLKKEGIAIAMKSEHWREEYKEDPRWKLKKIFNYELQNAEGKRSLLIFQSLRASQPVAD